MELTIVCCHGDIAIFLICIHAAVLKNGQEVTVLNPAQVGC